MRDSLGYPALNLGLNNQKLALLGLLTRAANERTPVALPRLSLFDPNNRQHVSVPFGQVFDEELIHRFGRRFAIDIVDGEPAIDAEGWSCFNYGAWLTGREVPRGFAAIDNLVCQFFAHLAPCIATTPPFQTLARSVFRERGIQTVIQMRIEKDWIAYSRESLETVPGHGVSSEEDYLPSFQTIMMKVLGTTVVPSKSAYIVCDEANLPVGKDEIRSEVSSRFGIDLVWKSDILPPERIAQYSILELSLLDFEMAVAAPFFVGLSRSTFSDLAGVERFCRTRENVETHFIYNSPGPSLGKRMDNGAQVYPKLVVDRLVRREALVARTEDDFRWPATLVAHIATYGDVTSETCSVPGARANPLVCGVRGSAPKLVEGFTLTLAATAPVGIEYRALLDDGSWTDWTPNGQFVGTHGQNRQLCGYSVRPTGEQALSLDCVCIGSFVGRTDLVIVGSGEACRSDHGARLEAMQIVFRPVFHTRRDILAEPDAYDSAG